MKYINEMNIIPLDIIQCTAAGTSMKIKHVGGDFSILCGAKYAATVVGTLGNTAADYSASKADNVVSFTVVEATSSTSAGSAISGATLDLGCATANTIRGGVIGIVEITSALTTSVDITINNRNFHIGTTGADGTVVATIAANVINGLSTGATAADKLPHYEVLPNAQASALLTISPDDDLGTGLTISASAAGIWRPLGGMVQGCINVQGSKLSTVTPKYIGVIVSETTAAVSKSVHMCRFNGAFPGAVVNCTT